VARSIPAPCEASLTCSRQARRRCRTAQGQHTPGGTGAHIGRARPEPVGTLRFEYNRSHLVEFYARAASSFEIDPTTEAVIAFARASRGRATAGVSDHS
jgi:hypothetical protein